MRVNKMTSMSFNERMSLEILELSNAILTLQRGYVRMMEVHTNEIEQLEEQMRDLIRNKHPEDVKLEQFYYGRPIGPVRSWRDCVPQGTERQCYIPQDKHWLYA